MLTALIITGLSEKLNLNQLCVQHCYILTSITIRTISFLFKKSGTVKNKNSSLLINDNAYNMTRLTEPL